jgi:hypothetical protein
VPHVICRTSSSLAALSFHHARTTSNLARCGPCASPTSSSSTLTMPPSSTHRHALSHPTSSATTARHPTNPTLPTSLLSMSCRTTPTSSALFMLLELNLVVVYPTSYSPTVPSFPSCHATPRLSLVSLAGSWRGTLNPLSRASLPRHHLRLPTSLSSALVASASPPSRPHYIPTPS